MSASRQGKFKMSQGDLDACVHRDGAMVRSIRVVRLAIFFASNALIAL